MPSHGKGQKTTSVGPDTNTITNTQTTDWRQLNHVNQPPKFPPHMSTKSPHNKIGAQKSDFLKIINKDDKKSNTNAILYLLLGFTLFIIPLIAFIISYIFFKKIVIITCFLLLSAACGIISILHGIRILYPDSELCFSQSYNSYVRQHNEELLKSRLDEFSKVLEDANDDIVDYEETVHPNPVTDPPMGGPPYQKITSQICQSEKLDKNISYESFTEQKMEVTSDTPLKSPSRKGSRKATRQNSQIFNTSVEMQVKYGLPATVVPGVVSKEPARSRWGRIKIFDKIF